MPATRSPKVLTLKMVIVIMCIREKLNLESSLKRVCSKNSVRAKDAMVTVRKIGGGP
jgi:hypothetical protein